MSIRPAPARDPRAVDRPLGPVALGGRVHYRAPVTMVVSEFLRREQAHGSRGAPRPIAHDAGEDRETIMSILKKYVLPYLAGLIAGVVVFGVLGLVVPHLPVSDVLKGAIKVIGFALAAGLTIPYLSRKMS